MFSKQWTTRTCSVLWQEFVTVLSCWVNYSLEPSWSTIFPTTATASISTFAPWNIAHSSVIQHDTLQQQQQQQQQRPFNGLWSGTTRVGRYQKELSPLTTTNTMKLHNTIKRSLFSFLRTLTMWHCPHLPTTVWAPAVQQSFDTCLPGPQQQTWTCSSRFAAIHQCWDWQTDGHHNIT